MRDAVLVPILVALWTANYRVYGAHKLWKAARRAGHDIGRDQVARLMRIANIHGVSRKRRLAHHHDRIRPRRGRRISSNATSQRSRPNELWVTDLTYVPTWAGVAYVCFIVDAFSRMIVGWRVAAHMRTDMVLDALEMARWSRGTQLEGLRCHSDAGSQFTSVRYGERLAELGAVPSIGSVGDSYDNALAETVNGLYKSELIRGPGQGPWKAVEDVELATLGWVHWHNTERLHGYLGDVPPAEFEAASTLPRQRAARRLESNNPSLHQTQGDSGSSAVLRIRLRHGDILPGPPLEASQFRCHPHARQSRTPPWGQLDLSHLAAIQTEPRPRCRNPLRYSSCG